MRQGRTNKRTYCRGGFADSNIHGAIGVGLARNRVREGKVGDTDCLEGRSEEEVVGTEGDAFSY